MGVGTPSDIIKSVACGIDMFDCVLPTRLGRTGIAFTTSGIINIRNSKFKNHKESLDNELDCPASKNYSKAYIHHLFKTQEILGYRIATQHNLSFYNNLILDAINAIENDNFDNWSLKFLKNYNEH